MKDAFLVWAAKVINEKIDKIKKRLTNLESKLKEKLSIFQQNIDNNFASLFIKISELETFKSKMEKQSR